MSATIDPMSAIWRSSTQLWSDRDVFRRWQDAIVALHELTVDDSGEEIRFSADEERRLHAAYNVALASVELVMRTLGNQIENMRKELAEMQIAAQMQSEELMEITRALMPSTVDREEN
jgi:hypothetical protein